MTYFYTDTGLIIKSREATLLAHYENFRSVLSEVTNPIYLVILEETSDHTKYSRLMKTSHDGSKHLMITHTSITIVMKFSESKIEIETIIDDLYNYHSMSYQQFTSVQNIVDTYT